MMRSILPTGVLVVLCCLSESDAQPAPSPAAPPAAPAAAAQPAPRQAAAPPSPPVVAAPTPPPAAAPQDIPKRIGEIEGRVGELEKAAKGADLLGVARSIEGRLQVIATNVSTTRDGVLLTLVVAVALAVGALVTTLLYQKNMIHAQENMTKAVGDVGGMVRSVTDRVPAPIVVAVDPQNGPVAGATVVRVRGRNFDRGAAVRFGESVATATTFVSPEVIQVSAPSGAPGPCDISVQNPDGGLDMLRSAYIYTPAPVIRGVFPNPIPVAGTTLTVLGGNFQPNARVQLNGAPTATTFGSENHVTCQIPAGQPGQAINIAIENPDHQSNQWGGQITYQ